MVLKVYSVQVSGIKCTNCAGKIQRGITQAIQDQIIKVVVNVMQQKVNITLQNDFLMVTVLQVLQRLGFPVIGQPIMLSGGDESQRSVTFRYQINSQTQKLEQKLVETVGIVKVNHLIQQNQIKLTVLYSYQVIKGRQIADIVQAVFPNYQIINQRVASFQAPKAVAVQQTNLIVTLVLCFFFLIFNMILPFTGQWYHTMSGYPQSFGIFSFSVILNFSLCIYVMIVYAKGFIVNAYKSYSQFGQTNMQTLIALGSVSAFALSLFLIVRFSIETMENSQFSRHQAIMQINDSLTSASIIVLVVTIGKYYEGKIKKKIDRITSEIFPESTLFSNMKVEHILIKNRKLMIQGRKNYDVTVIQKGDILALVPGRLLLDVIVISGSIKATQSTVSGCDDIVLFQKGDRIQSGSIIHQVAENSLVEVENVFQKSILIEIGTQIKLTQNQEESQKTGIQAVCKTIASYFVKAVILLSIIVMVTWFFLLAYDAVQVPMCDLCWIVERGIGVLVASCPCALGLAVPSVIAIVLNLAIKSGILIRNNSVFEKMKKCKIISFDKTGTLFTRMQKIQGSQVLCDLMDENSLWEVVAVVERTIRHPLAEILYKQAFNLSKINGSNFNFLLIEKPVIEKEGVSAKVRSKLTQTNYDVRIGNRYMMKNNGIEIPLYQNSGEGSTELFLSLNGVVYLVIFLNTHSNLRPQAQEVVSLIQKLGKQVHILSGDSLESVQKLAQHLNIPNECLHAQQSAFMKMEWIKNLQTDGKVGVLMVGDGLNDIPCLQEAAIGVSINAKSELNINAASIVILSQNLHKILALIRMVRMGNIFITLNLCWAFSYNITIMPFVAGVFYGLNLYISPVWSSIAMSVSSILVVIFAQFLTCFHFDDSLLKENQDLQSMKNEKQVIKNDMSHSDTDKNETTAMNSQTLIPSNKQVFIELI